MDLLTHSLEVWQHISPKPQRKHKATKQDWKDNKVLGYIGLFWRNLRGSDVGYSSWDKDALSPSLGLNYPASSSQDLHSDRSIHQEENHAADDAFRISKKNTEHSILPVTLTDLYWFLREQHFRLYV